MDVIKKIEDYSLEEIMSLRFAAYAKEIIQDRAIPDVRDGLKPVQRRILYAMYKAGNTSEKGYIKCAATVGDVLGKFHPHGDSSVYDAMVRMSQWWKQSHILVDIHGNNGSMDGDPPSAPRLARTCACEWGLEAGPTAPSRAVWAAPLRTATISPTRPTRTIIIHNTLNKFSRISASSSDSGSWLLHRLSTTSNCSTHSCASLPPLPPTGCSAKESTRCL